MIHRKSQLSVPKTRNTYIRHSIYCKPYYILGSVEVTIHACGGFPGASRRLQGLQGPPGPSRSLQGLQGPQGLPGPLERLPEPNENAACRVLPKPRTFGEAEISCGMVRPTMAGGGGGVARLRRVCKGSRGGLRLDASANFE